MSAPFLATTAEVTIHSLRLARPPAAVILTLTVALTLGLLTPAARAETVHGVPLPRGSRVADPARPSSDLFTSGRGFRDTVEHVRRHLKKTGSPHQAIPIYRRGPVTVARFIARQPGLPWLAIHVFQHTGKTFIAIIPTPPAGAPPPPKSPPPAATPPPPKSPPPAAAPPAPASRPGT